MALGKPHRTLYLRQEVNHEAKLRSLKLGSCLLLSLSAVKHQKGLVTSQRLGRRFLLGGCCVCALQDLEAMCPNWHPVEEKLCESSEEMAAVRKQLMQNPSYSKIGPCCSTSVNEMKILGSLRNRLDYTNFLRLEKAVKTGKATVCITFAVYVLYVKAPNEPLMSARQNLLKELKEELSKKGHELNACMVSRMEELLQPSASGGQT